MAVQIETNNDVMSEQNAITNTKDEDNDSTLGDLDDNDNEEGDDVASNDDITDEHLDADIESDGNSEDETEQQQGLAGMSDVISKILEKSLAPEKDAVLAKCKRSTKRKSEIQEERVLKKEKRDAKKAILDKNHVIPTRSNAHTEVLLRKIATKGVVKLFNAVSAHQKSMSEKMKEAKTEARKSKAIEGVSKSSFLDFLKKDGEDKAKVKVENKKTVTKQEVSSEDDASEEEGKSSWNVLRDDFMMGAKFKDWDKDDAEEEESDTNHMSSDEDEDGDDKD